MRPGSSLIMLLLIGVLLLPGLAATPRPVRDLATPVQPAALPPTLEADPQVAVPPVAAMPYAGLPRELQGKPEMVERRTASSATFDMGDNTYALLHDTVPLHYQDAAGQWQPVNPSFAPLAGGWADYANTLQTTLTQRSSNARVGTGAVGVGWQPRSLTLVNAAGDTHLLAVPLEEAHAAPGTRSADGSTVRYQHSWESPSVQDQWQVRPGSSEYSLRLAERPERGSMRHPDSLDVRVHLHLRPGTTLQSQGQPVTLPLETSAPLSLVGADGSELLLQPPYAYEQQHPTTATAGRYQLVATTDPSVIELRVRIAWNWLAAHERQYPVIIDPQFQVRSPLSAYNAFYPNDTRAFLEQRALAPLELGQFNDGVQRLAVEFNAQPLPPGAVVERAYLAVTPQDVAFTTVDYLAAPVQAYNLSGFNGSEPLAGTPVPFAAGSDTVMRFSRGERDTPTLFWDVSALAPAWFAPAGLGGRSSYGVLLRTTNEFCNPDPQGCGAFYIDHPSTWGDADLQSTASGSSNPDNPYFPATSGSGVRLLVHYTAPALSSTVETAPPGGDVSPYYQAAHTYRLAPAGGWWAVAARGLLPAQELDPHVPPPPGVLEQTQTIRHIAGHMPLRLSRDTDDTRLAATPQDARPDEVSYLLVNGTAAPDLATRLRVERTTATQPPTYDVRPVYPTASVNAVLNAPDAVTYRYEYDTGDPLTLWNLNIPAGSNARVDIFVYRNNINTRNTSLPPNTYFNYARDFSAGLFPASSPDVVRSQAQAIALNNYAPPTGNLIPDDDGFLGDEGIRLGYGPFTTDSSSYALALAYNGPQIDAFSCTSYRGGEFPYCAEYAKPRMTFTLDVQVTACGPDAQGNATFPTVGGTCQPVRCPSLTAFPGGSDNYRDTGTFGLWSESGWNGSDSVQNGLAPLVGGAGRSVPGVLVVGGYLKNTGTGVQVLGGTALAPPTIVLVNCGTLAAPNNPLSEAHFFAAFDAPMNTSGAVLLPTSPPGDTYARVWNSAGDPNDPANLPDLGNSSLSVNPALGTLNVSAQLNLLVGDRVDSRAIQANGAGWSLDYRGWLGLQGSVSSLDGGLPTVASLVVVGQSAPTFDLPPPTESSKHIRRSFRSLRISSATIYQPSELGGASKPAQVLIFPRGISVADSTPPLQCADLNGKAASCIDLRAPDDTLDQPNRRWALPDIRTNTQANTVAFSTAGVFQVFSNDHPAAGVQQGVPQEYSFSTNGATVSVQRERCRPDEAQEVTVVRGETRISLPGVGDTSNEQSSMIAATFKLCQSTLRNVSMTFSSPVGIPLGNSGLFMTSLSGSMDINPGYTTITLKMGVQAAQGGDGGILRGTGTVTIDTRGLFALQADYKLLGFINANGKLWVAWNPLDMGYEARISIGDWLTGTMRAHIWRGQGWGNRYTWLPANDETHLAAQIAGEIDIKEGAIFRWWFIDIPPDDVELGVELAFGQFCTSPGCASYAWGIKGTLTIAGYDIGLYYNIGSDLTSPRIGFDTIDFILGNDDHVLIDQVGGAQTAPILQAAGFNLRAAPQQVDDVARIPLTVSPAAEQLLFGLGWQAGSPRLTLITPAGEEITPANATSHSATVTGTAQSTLMVVQNPTPGAWQAQISNLSTDGREQYKFIYLANKGAPGTPTNRGRFLAPITADELISDTYTLRWEVPPDTPETTTISLFAHPQYPDDLRPTDASITIAQHVPFTAGSYAWDSTRFANGHYELVGIVDDGINIAAADLDTPTPDGCPAPGSDLPPARAFAAERFPGTVVFTSTGVFVGNFQQPAAAPTNVQVSGVDGGLLVRWDAVDDPSINLYRVRWGFVAGEQFFAIGQQLVNASPDPALHVVGLQNDVEYGVQVSVVYQNPEFAYASEPVWSAPVLATPAGETIPVLAAPTALMVTAITASSASFTWQPPAGTAPTSYRVAVIRLGDDADLAQHDTADTSITITDLQPGATYDVRVRAASVPGWYGVPSDAVRVVASDGQDSDGDGLPDDWATAYVVSGEANDADADGLSNADEVAALTNPTRQDSDGDGFSDAEEVAQQTDPLDSTSYSAALLQPRLHLAEDVLVFRNLPDMPTASQAVLWRNTGGGVLNLTASSSATWLTAHVLSDTVVVTIDPTVSRPGFQSGVVRLEPAAGSDPLIGGAGCIRVDAWVSSAEPPITLSIGGPTSGLVNTSYAFVAVAGPSTVATPLTYRWEATDQPPVTSADGLSNEVAFAWDTPGSKVITVTVDNGIRTASTSYQVAINSPVPGATNEVASITLDGPTEGISGTAYRFTASVGPATATTPISYTWQADDQAPITMTGTLTNTVSFTWESPGTKRVTVTASNGKGSPVTGTLPIVIRQSTTPPPNGQRVYLPLVRR